MHRKLMILTLILLGLGLMVTWSAVSPAIGQGPLKVCTSTRELGSLVREIGGNQVSATVFAKGTENPHFVEAKPSFIKALSQADLFVEMGLELEMGWAPVLLQNASNGQVLHGALGYLDACAVISPMEIPSGTMDRSKGSLRRSVRSA
jgi:zinc/manganese transport system substrate-binding protein